MAAAEATVGGIPVSVLFNPALPPHILQENREWAAHIQQEEARRSGSPPPRGRRWARRSDADANTDADGVPDQQRRWRQSHAYAGSDDGSEARSVGTRGTEGASVASAHTARSATPPPRDGRRVPAGTLLERDAELLHTYDEAVEAHLTQRQRRRMLRQERDEPASAPLGVPAWFSREAMEDLLLQEARAVEDARARKTRARCKAVIAYITDSMHRACREGTPLPQRFDITRFPARVRDMVVQTLQEHWPGLVAYRHQRRPKPGQPARKPEHWLYFPLDPHQSSASAAGTSATAPAAAPPRRQ